MPSYIVTDNLTGKKYRLTGDSAPTEQELSQIFGSRQPQQEQPPQKSLGGFVENIGKSAVENVKGMGQAIIHPVQTAKAIGNTALGAGQLLIPGEQGKEEYARNVGRFYKDRYGSWQGFKDTLYNDPVGVALDASTAIGAGAGAIKGVSKVANVAGKAETASKLANTAKTLDKVSRVTDPIQQTGKLLGGVPNKAGKFLENRGEDIAVAGLGSPKTLRQAEGLAGTKFGEFFDKYNLWDRSPETAQKVIKSVGEKYDDLAVNSGKTMKAVDIVQAFDDEIAKLAQDAKQSEVVATQMNDLIRRRNAFITSLPTSKSTTGIEQITKSKRAVAQDVPQSMFGLDPSGTGKAKSARTTYDIFKKKIGELEPATKQLGRDEASLIKLKEVFESAKARGQGRQLLNFSKLGTTGAGAIVAGLPGAIAGYAIESLVNSPVGTKIISNVFRKSGKGLQRYRTPSKLSPIYTFSKYSSRVPKDDSRIE